MTEQDQERFAVLMDGVAEYYGKKLSGPVIEIYWQALSSFAYEEVAHALSLHMQDPDHGTFMPKVSDIRRVLAGNKQTQAMVAWSKVEKAIRTVGPYSSVVFDDPNAHAVIEDMGGWVHLCSIKSEEDLHFAGIEFQKRYQGYVLQGGAQDYPQKLIGISEAHNIREEQAVEPPMLIGNPARAKQILLAGRQGSKLQIERADGVAVRALTDLANRPAPRLASGGN